MNFGYVTVNGVDSNVAGLHAIVAVSYTHLDVYKRQPEDEELSESDDCSLS